MEAAQARHWRSWLSLPVTHGAAPELLEAAIPATALGVLVVLDRILLIEILVVFLGPVELRGWRDLGDDCRVKLFLHAPLRFFGHAALSLVVEEDRRPVLAA